VAAADPRTAGNGQPFGRPGEDPVTVSTPEAEVINIRLPEREISDRAQTWLRNAMTPLAVLAAGPGR
jgi:hypothetical protein